MSTNSTRRRKAKKRPAPPTQDAHLERIANAAVLAWQLCEAAYDWPVTIDQMLLVEWQGRQIAWPGYKDECFSIFAVDDSGVVTEEDLANE